MARSTSVTKPKKSIAKSEELNPFFQDNPLPMWIYDRETLAFLAVNDAAIEQYGFSEKEFLGMTIKDIRPEADVAALLADLGKDRPVSEHGAEWRHRTKDGRILIIEISSHLFEYKKRNAALVVANDVTQRKIVELALRESEGRLRFQAELVENVSDAIISCNLDFHIITWNRAAEGIYGWKLEEVIGQDWDELCQTAYTGITREKLADELFTTGKWSGEVEQKRKDGKSIYIQSQISIVRNEVGMPVRLATVNRDISSRRLTEGALRESQRQLATLMSNLPGMAYRGKHDPEWVMEFVSDGCEALTGYKPEHLIGNRKISYEQIAHPDDLRRVHEAIANGVRNRLPYEMTYRIVSASGQEKWVWEQGRAIYEPDGSAIAIEGFITDTTERIDAEHALRESEERFRAAFEQAAVGVTQILPDGTFLNVNQKFCEIVGYAYTDLIGQNMHEFIHPADRLAFSENVEPLLKGQASAFSIENRFVRQDGFSVWVNLSVGLVRHDDGSPKSLIGVIEDISERKTRERELEALYQGGTSLRQISDPKIVAQKVIELLENHMEWHHASVWMRQGQSENIEQLAYSRPGPDLGGINQEQSKSRAMIRTIHTGLSGWVIGHGTSVRSADVVNDPRYTKVTASIVSGLYVPLKVGTATIGCISAESTRADAFTAYDERLLTTVASQAAVALENARLYQETRESAARRDVLHRASNEIAQASQDVEKVYVAVHRAAKKLMRADVFTIMLYHPEQNEIHGVYLFDQGKRLAEIKLPLGEGLSGQVVSTGKSILIADFLTQNKIKSIKIGKSKARARSILAVPMRVAGQIAGVISAQSYAPDLYTQDDEVLLEMLAAYAGVAIQNAALFEKTHLHAMEMASISALGHTLAETANLDEMYRALVPVIYELLPDIAGMFVSLFDAKTNLIRCVCGHVEGRFIEHNDLPPMPLAAPGEGRQSQVIHTRQPLIIGEMTDGPVSAVANTIVGDNSKPSHSALFAPMISNNKVIGVIQVQSYTPQRFTEADAQILSLIANTASVEIQNARLLEDTLWRAAQLSQLNALGHELAGTLSLQNIYQIAHQYIHRFLVFAQFGISLYDPLRKNINPVFLVVNGEEVNLSGLSFEHAERTWSQAGRARAISTASPVILNDATADAAAPLSPNLSAPADQTGGAAVYIPMVVDGLVIGLLEVESDRKDAYVNEDAELLSTIANQIGLSIQNARLFTQIEHQLQQLSALRTIDNAISSNTDLNTTLSIILDHVKSELGVDAADILLLRPETMTLEYAASRGFHADAIQRISLRLGEGIAGRTAMERKPKLIENLAEGQTDFHYAGLLSAEQFVTYANAPLVSKGQLKGVLEVFQRSLLKTDREWLSFLEMMANEAAIAIDNADLFNELQRSNLDLTIAYDATIEGWAQALELRDFETEGHSRRVAEMTLRLARQLDIQGSELVHMRRGSLLHDIGNMGIPDSVLRKPGPLNEAEWVIIRQHPVLAHTLLARIPYLRSALDIPYNHHERWDGSGYPRKLRGEQIPLSARIFSVVDVYDSLTSDRPYRPALGPAQACEYIREQMGRHFDPKVAEAFLKMVEIH